MSYPLVIAPKGEHIARINHNGQWSARWDRVEHFAYEPITHDNLALVKTCEVLLRTKDRFWEMDWATSDSLENLWNHYCAVIDYDSTEMNGTRMVVGRNKVLMAKINSDATWSVKWDLVTEMADSPEKGWDYTALIGMCQMLKLARDNFEIRAWDLPEDDS